MKNFFVSVALLCASLVACAQTVTITSSLLQDGGAAANGTIYWAPVLQNGQPISFHRSGGGISTLTPVTATVTAGAFSMTFPDTSLTNPANPCISVKLSTAKGGNVLGPGYGCVQPSANNSWCTAGVCNFDNYAPNLTSQMTYGLGPQGVPGIGADPNCHADGSGNLTCGSLAARVSTMTPSAVPSFTIAVFPDVQDMNGPYNSSAACVEGSPCTGAAFKGMTAWVVANASTYNIVAVAGVGDNVNDTDATSITNSAAGWATVLNAGLPSISAEGNHDYDGEVTLSGQPPANRASTNFLGYMGPSALSGKSWYGGYFSSADATTSANEWIKFTVGSQQYAILTLEFCPRAESMAWAAGVIAANPATQFIILTHSYLDDLGQLTPTGYVGGSCSLHFASDAADGPAIWSTFASQYPNIFMVLNGHFYNAPTNSVNGANLVQLGTNGNSVDAMFANYQNENPQTGTLRLVTVNPSQGTISVSTYSTGLGVWRTDPSNQFTMPMFGPEVSGSASAGGAQAAQIVHGTRAVISDNLVQGQTVTATGIGSPGQNDNVEGGVAAESSSTLNRDGTFSATTNFADTNPGYTGENYITGYTNLLSYTSGFGAVPSLIGRSANGTMAYPLPLANQQPVFEIAARSWDGTAASFNGTDTSPAAIAAISNGNTTTSNHGAYWQFLTTPYGSTTRYPSVNLFTFDLEVGPTTLPFSTGMTASDIAVNAPVTAEFYYNVTGAPVNETIWRTVTTVGGAGGNCTANHGCWQLQVANDAVTSEVSAIEVSRNLNAITGIYLDGPVISPALTTPSIGGTTITHSPEIPWTAEYLWTVPLTAANRSVGASITPRYAIAFTDIDIAFNTLASCSTPQQLQLYDETSAGAVGPTVTLANGNGIQHYSFSYAATAGHTYVLETAVAATCATDPIVNITLQYQMQ